jgi:ABC-type transporter Mla subunit MlaD
MQSSTNCLTLVKVNMSTDSEIKARMKIDVADLHDVCELNAQMAAIDAAIDAAIEAVKSSRFISGHNNCEPFVYSTYNKSLDLLRNIRARIECTIEELNEGTSNG